MMTAGAATRLRPGCAEDNVAADTSSFLASSSLTRVRLGRGGPTGEHAGSVPGHLGGHLGGAPIALFAVAVEPARVAPLDADGLVRADAARHASERAVEGPAGGGLGGRAGLGVRAGTRRSRDVEKHALASRELNAQNIRRRSYRWWTLSRRSQHSEDSQRFYRARNTNTRALLARGRLAPAPHPPRSPRSPRTPRASPSPGKSSSLRTNAESPVSGASAPEAPGFRPGPREDASFFFLRRTETRRRFASRRVRVLLLLGVAVARRLRGGRRRASGGLPRWSRAEPRLRPSASRFFPNLRRRRTFAAGRRSRGLWPRRPPTAAAAAALGGASAARSAGSDVRSVTLDRASIGSSIGPPTSEYACGSPADLALRSSRPTESRRRSILSRRFVFRRSVARRRRATTRTRRRPADAQRGASRRRPRWRRRRVPDSNPPRRRPPKRARGG